MKSLNKENWCNFYNLRFNPFQYPFAEDDDRLSKYFIMNSFFSNVRDKKNIILTSPLGTGKTAILSELNQTHCLGDFQDNPFSLPIFWSIYSISSTTNEELLEWFFQTIYSQIIIYLFTKSEYFLNLQKEFQKEIIKIIGELIPGTFIYPYKFASSESFFSYYWRKSPASLRSDFIIKPSHNKLFNLLTNSEKNSTNLNIKNRIQLIKTLLFDLLGTSTINLLIDDTSFSHFKTPKGKLILNLISEIENNFESEFPKNFHFKIFISEKYLDLKSYYSLINIVGDHDIVNLKWDNKSLSQLLNKRLFVSSQRKITSLNHFSPSILPFNVEDYFIEKYHPTPRFLVILAENLLFRAFQFDIKKQITYKIIKDTENWYIRNVISQEG